MEDTKLESLMSKINELNKKNKKLEEYVYELNLAQAQDAVKEDMAFTINWTKKDWDKVAKDMHETQVAFEKSFTEEQKKLYDKLQDFQMLATLSQNNGKK